MPVERRPSPSPYELAALGLYLAAAVAVPLVIGLRIDQALHSSPVGLLLGLLVGLAAAGLGLWAQLRRYL